MILITRVSQLNTEWKQAINNLILGAFAGSRLDDYERVVCYYVRGEVVGMVGLNHTQGYMCLNQLVVGETHRHKGIASLLLREVFGRYPGVNMILYVDKNRPNTDCLVYFYTKLGFKPVQQGEAQELPRDDGVEVLMLKRGFKDCNCEDCKSE